MCGICVYSGADGNELADKIAGLVTRKREYFRPYDCRKIAINLAKRRLKADAKSLAAIRLDDLSKGHTANSLRKTTG